MKKVKSLDVSRRQKKIFPPIKGKACLEISFCYFHCSAVEVSCLKMVSNEFNSLSKTFAIKIVTFPSTLEMLGYYYTITICEKARGFKLHVTNAIYFCKFVAFSILPQTQPVHSEVSFIIYSALSNLPICAVRFVVTFEGLAKTFQFFKNTAAIQYNISISF